MNKYQIFWSVIAAILLIIFGVFTWQAIKYAYKVYFGKHVLKTLKSSKNRAECRESIRTFRVNLILSIEMALGFAYCFMDCVTAHILGL